jgi:hypothetical protein
VLSFSWRLTPYEKASKGTVEGLEGKEPQPEPDQPYKKYRPEKKPLLLCGEF